MANVVPAALLNQFPLTAPDLAWNNPPVGFGGDTDAIMTETVSELQNLTQDLTNRLVENPGSNPDFGPNNTRGVGILLYLSCDAETFATLGPRIDAEFVQDSRVTNSLTTITANPPGALYPYTINSTVETVAGVFGLAWGWSSSGLVPLPPTVGGS